MSADLPGNRLAKKEIAPGDIPICRDQLLWHASGLHWGYEYLLLPRNPRSESWGRLILQLFPEQTVPEPGKTTKLAGLLPAELRPRFLGRNVLSRKVAEVHPALQETCDFFVAAFQYVDGEHRDVVGRPIVHTLLWLLPASDQNEYYVKSLPFEWDRIMFGFIYPLFSEELYNIPEKK